MDQGKNSLLLVVPYLFNHHQSHFYDYHYQCKHQIIQFQKCKQICNIIFDVI